jgi:hypothetical protein
MLAQCHFHHGACQTEFPMSDVYQPGTPRIRDAPPTSPTIPAEDMRTGPLSKISWGAVFAGVVVALATQLLLNLLGMGIGAGTLNPVGDDSPSATSLSIGAGIWFAVSGILAALAGGYTAGRLAGVPNESTAGWHGLTTWALATLVIFYLLTSTLGGILGGAYRGMTSAIGGVANAVGSTAQTAAQVAAPSVSQMADPFSSIEQSLRGTIPGNDPAALRDAAVAAMRAAVTGDPQQAAEARERAAQAIERALNISVEDAHRQVQQYEQQYRQAIDHAKQQAKQTADTAAKTVSRAGLFGFISLLLGAIAAWFGGRMGAIEQPLRVERSTTRRGF